MDRSGRARSPGSPGLQEDSGPLFSHPVYSDFSHIASNGFGNTRFAVSLRETDPEAMVNRILPLAKVIPGVKKERPIRKVEKEEKICTRPECIERRESLKSMNSENEYLRIQYREVAARVAAAKNKVALAEKTVDIAEERNENLRAQIDEAQSKILSIEGVVEKGEAKNQILRHQLSSLVDEINVLKAQVEKYNESMRTIFENESGPKVVFQSSQYSSHHNYYNNTGNQNFSNSTTRDITSELEVASLSFGQDDIDSDND